MLYYISIVLIRTRHLPIKKQPGKYLRDGKEMELTIECPPGIIGSLYVCFADKDKKGRTGYLVFEGRDYESGKQDQEESWVKLHIMREDSNDGILRLKAKVKNGPDLVISKVAIMEE